MASDIVSDAIRAYLTSNWVETPIQYENESFEPPALMNWVALEMTGTLYGQMSLGADVQSENRWDEEGVLWLHVFVKTGSGSSTLRRQCKALADLFRGARLLNDAIEFLDAQIGMGDQGDDDGTTYRISVSIDWRREDA